MDSEAVAKPQDSLLQGTGTLQVSLGLKKQVVWVCEL